jgi:hypothetical protein
MQDADTQWIRACHGLWPGDRVGGGVGDRGARWGHEGEKWLTGGEKWGRVGHRGR